jgi:hypothetical protein
MENGMTDQKMRLARQFEVLHKVACEKFGIAPNKRGAKTLITTELNVTLQQYSDAIRGRRGSMDLLLEWARRLRIPVQHGAEGSVTIGSKVLAPLHGWWTRRSWGTAIHRDATSGLTSDEHAVVMTLCSWSVMKGQEIWYWGTSTTPERWELEGKAGIAYFGPNETDTDNPASKLVIATRHIPDLDGVTDPIEAARIVVRNLELPPRPDS